MNLCIKMPCVIGFDKRIGSKLFNESNNSKITFLLLRFKE